MTDEEQSISDATLITRLRSVHSAEDCDAAADRIEQLVATNEALLKVRREDALELIAAHGQAHDAYEAQLKAEARAEQLAAINERLAALLDRAVNGPWLDGDLERARAALTEAQKDRTDD